MSTRCQNQITRLKSKSLLNTCNWVPKSLNKALATISNRIENRLVTKPQAMRARPEFPLSESSDESQCPGRSVTTDGRPLR